MRDRLIELIENIKTSADDTRCLGEVIAEELIANGVIVPPCKVGDILFVITQMNDNRILPFINEHEVTSLSIQKKGIIAWHEMDGYVKSFRHKDFGKTVFLTREEAEKELERRRNP